MEGKHEFTVASGRVDSVYDRVIIEYKNPSNSASRIGPKADCPGAKEVTAQIIKRFYDLRQEHGQALNSMFGVGLDGNFFIFVRYRDDKWEVTESGSCKQAFFERFLWALFNLGRKGKSFTPENLEVDFGSESKLAQEGVRTLYQSVLSSSHPKVTTFFNQWKILFGEVELRFRRPVRQNVSSCDLLWGRRQDTQSSRIALRSAHVLCALHEIACF